MNGVLWHLARRADEYAAAPLFAFLRDEHIDPRRRLAFVPAAAHFVMSFADLYRFVLPTATATDRFEEITNAHVAEDSGHWKWYLADLASMGLDPRMPFTEAVRFLWSDVTLRTRRLSYDICGLSARRESIERLVIVLVIEATGGVTLNALAPAGAALERRIERRLVYFGEHHVNTESQHTVEQDSTRGWLESITLDAAARVRLCALADETFDAFRGFADDCYRIASGDGPSLRPFLRDEHSSPVGQP